MLVKSSDPIELAGLCDRVLVMSRGQIIEEIPGDELDELRIVEAMVRGPGLSRAGRSPLGRRDAEEPSSNGRREQPRSTQRASRSARSSATHATRTSGGRSSSSACGCRWRCRSCWSLALLFYTTSRFPGFVNATTSRADPDPGAPPDRGRDGQTHALLVGYLDLSVGGMIGLGVVIASFLIGDEASLPQILFGVGVILLCGVALGLVNAGLIRGLKIPRSSPPWPR